MEIRQKLTRRVPLSRALKVIGIDTDRLATYRFQLVFRSNYGGPISYRFRHKGRYLQKFPTPCH